MFSKAAVELLSSAMSSSYQWSNNYTMEREVFGSDFEKR
jgi:hypothetical protein